MIVKQIINNNVVMSEDFKGSEVILVGKGIGFESRKGDTIDENKIIKTFTLVDEDEKDKTM